jgi:hypothetical protein
VLTFIAANGNKTGQSGKGNGQNQTCEATSQTRVKQRRYAWKGTNMNAHGRTFERFLAAANPSSRSKIPKSPRFHTRSLVILTSQQKKPDQGLNIDFVSYLSP